ncbi:3471_t:CDS:2, partial [Dentiscutata erythropus]
MRNTHEIHNYFYANTLKTCLICNLCDNNYPSNTNLTNLKNHFAKYHVNEYHNYSPEKEIVEVIESGQALPPLVQNQNKRKIIIEEK